MKIVLVLLVLVNILGAYLCGVDLATSLMNMATLIVVFLNGAAAGWCAVGVFFEIKDFKNRGTKEIS